MEFSLWNNFGNYIWYVSIGFTILDMFVGDIVSYQLKEVGEVEVLRRGYVQYEKKAGVCPPPKKCFWEAFQRKFSMFITHDCASGVRVSIYCFLRLPSTKLHSAVLSIYMEACAAVCFFFVYGCSLERVGHHIAP